MKKLLLSSAAIIGILASSSAFAQVSIGVNLGGPAFYAPPPVIVGGPPVVIERPWTYDPHHIHRDRDYWRARRFDHGHDHDHR